MHKYIHQQQSPWSLQDCWDFFSQPENLVLLTPPKMKMKIMDRPKGDLYPGAMIEFKVSPIPGIKQSWISEISQQEAPNYFIDTMIDGPFVIWHHEHRFESNNLGTLITDIVYYKVPLGPLGLLANQLFVKNQVKELFSFRKHKLEQLFAK